MHGINTSRMVRFGAGDRTNGNQTNIPVSKRYYYHVPTIQYIPRLLPHLAVLPMSLPWLLEKESLEACVMAQPQQLCSAVRLLPKASQYRLR